MNWKNNWVNNKYVLSNVQHSICMMYLKMQINKQLLYTFVVPVAVITIRNRILYVQLKKILFSNLKVFITMVSSGIGGDQMGVTELIISVVSIRRLVMMMMVTLLFAYFETITKRIAAFYHHSLDKNLN